jgi:rRNA processing protein Gar1
MMMKMIGNIKNKVMIKDKKEIGIQIDLTGPDGNSFMLIGRAINLAKQLGLDGKAIQVEMMNGDYEHLVNTFDKHFGHLVTLYR